MSDTLTDFRLLNIIDDFNRQSLAIEVDTSQPALRVIRALQKLIDHRGKPGNIRCDNGPEFISHKLQQWCDDQQITLQYIQPGEPTQNAFVERNNGALRRELLDARMFTSLREVRMMVAEWQKDYNENRPHKALLYQSPMMSYNNWLNGELKMSASTEALSPSAGVGPKRPQAKTIVDKVLEIPKDDCNYEILLLNGTTLREPDKNRRYILSTSFFFVQAYHNAQAGQKDRPVPF